MSSKGNAFENELLDLLFHNLAIENIGDAGGLLPAATQGSLYAAMHTGDPGEAGTADTSETAYTGYARQAIARNSGGFTISTNVVTLAADVDFPECTAAPGTALTHFSITTAASGASMILYYGPLTPNISMSIGTIPRLKASTNITED